MRGVKPTSKVWKGTPLCTPHTKKDIQKVILYIYPPQTGVPSDLPDIAYLPLLPLYLPAPDHSTARLGYPVKTI